MNKPAILASSLLVTLAATAPARAGEKILRFGPSFVDPTSQARADFSGRIVFDDPADPPMGTFDVFQRTVGSVDGAAGVGVGFEFKPNGWIGIETQLGYSRHDFSLDFSGDITWTPWVEDLGGLDEQQRENAPILGGAGGHHAMSLATVGVNFHVLRRPRLGLYFGPLAGLCYSETDFDAGRFTASFSEFTSQTPVEARKETSADFVYGAVVGADLPFGDRGWMVSTAVRYLETEPEIDPWTFQAGLGFSF